MRGSQGWFETENELYYVACDGTVYLHTTPDAGHGDTIPRLPDGAWQCNPRHIDPEWHEWAEQIEAGTRGATAQARERADRQGTGEAATEPQEESMRGSQGWFETENELYYVACDGTVYLHTTPDAGHGDTIPRLPDGAWQCNPRHIDPEWHEWAEQIEAGTRGATAQARERADRQGTGEAATEPQEESMRGSQGWFETENELYYVACDGTVYLHTTPDAGHGDTIPRLPDGAWQCNPRHIDPEWHEWAEQIEAGTRGATAQARERADRQGTGEAATEPQEESMRGSQGWFETENELYYVACDGTVYLHTTPDAGHGDTIPRLPDGAWQCNPRHIDPEWHEWAEQIEAGTRGAK